MSGVDNINGFLNEVTEIEQRIASAKTNIEKIQVFQGQILNSTSTAQEDVSARERETLISSTRNLLVECKDRVKRIQIDNSRIPSTDPNFGIRQQRYEFLKTKLSNVLEDYRKAESNFMKQTKDRMARQYKVVNPDATQQEIDKYVNSTDSRPIFQQALLRTSEAENALAEVQKRHEDIKNIESTIAELVSLVQELQLQVEEQDQTVIDIEQNAGDIVHKVEQSNTDLGKATTLAMSARKKKWICFGIVVLIIIIIVVVVLTQLPKLRGDDSPQQQQQSPSKSTSTPTTSPVPS